MIWRWLLIFLIAPFTAYAQGVGPLPSIPPIVGANVSELQLKTSPGYLLDGYVTVGSAGYIFLFNSSSQIGGGNFTAGTAVNDYQDCIQVTQAGTYGLSSFGLPMETFSGGSGSGILLAFSSTGCGTFTPATAVFMKGRVQ